MNRIQKRIFLFSVGLFVAGCGNGTVDKDSNEVAVTATAPEVTFKPGPGKVGDHTVEPQGPVTIAYKIIGTPIVGQPLGVDLQVQSTLGPQEITLSYRINDQTAMQLSEAQPARVSIAPSNDPAPALQQVRLVPLREGRLFLNVSASVQGEGSTFSSVTAIPIQVGAAVREIQENGTLTRDENGELIRSLPASSN